MTLLGKIFTVLIFIMSVAFCILAVATFATHKNWRLIATNPTPGPGQTKGLKEQIEELNLLNQKYQAQLEQAQRDLAMEQAARRAVLATLQGKITLFQDDLTKQAEELLAKTSQLTSQTSAAEVAEKTLESITAEVKKLREEIRLAQLDRDEIFGNTVELTDKLNQAEALRQRLEEQNRALQDQYAQLEKVAKAMGFDARTLVSAIPPPLDGYVLSVQETKGLVEVSLGSDEGLKKGHVLQVYRGNQYLGQIIIRELEPDRAVGQIDKKMQRGRITKGDNVTTKLS